MKIICILVTLCSISLCCKAQTKLPEKDFNNLVALSQLYTGNVNASGEQFAKTADSLRTPLLNHMVDVLILLGKADTRLLENKYISRLGHDELMYWYVLREIHYNHVDKSRKQRPDKDLAQDVLTQTIDDRWLLDNYYYRIISGVAMLFNDADLSNYNFDMDKLGFKDATEKAIFYCNMMDGLVNSRFRVLQYLKKNDKILEFSKKLPKFNGKAYFYYTNLSFPDFEWMPYDKTESFKQRNINNLINTIMNQFTCYATAGDKASAKELYFNSIAHIPEYFKYSTNSKDLEQVYATMKQ